MKTSIRSRLKKRRRFRKKLKKLSAKNKTLKKQITLIIIRRTKEAIKQLIMIKKVVATMRVARIPRRRVNERATDRVRRILILIMKIRRASERILLRRNRVILIQVRLSKQEENILSPRTEMLIRNKESPRRDLNLKTLV